MASGFTDAQLRELRAKFRTMPTELLAQTIQDFETSIAEVSLPSLKANYTQRRDAAKLALEDKQRGGEVYYGDRVTQILGNEYKDLDELSLIDAYDKSARVQRDLVCRYVHQLQLLRNTNKEPSLNLPSMSAVLQAVENLQTVEGNLKEVVKQLERS